MRWRCGRSLGGVSAMGRYSLEGYRQFETGAGNCRSKTHCACVRPRSNVVPSEHGSELRARRRDGGDVSELALADAINQLRREIGRSIEAAAGERLQFVLGAVELELQVELSARAGATAETRWVVVSLGAEAGGERTRTHKVTVTLTPQFDGKGDVTVNDRRPYRE